MFSKIMWSIVILAVLAGINTVIQQKVAPGVMDAQIKSNPNLVPVVPVDVANRPSSQIKSSNTITTRTTTVTANFLYNTSGWIVSFVGLLIFWPLWRKEIKQVVVKIKEGM